MSNKNSTDKDLNSLLEDIKIDLLDYINKRIKLFKLDSFEALSFTVSAVGYSLIVLLVTAIILFFILMGMAFYLSELLNSHAIGFGIMALFSLLILLIIILNKKAIKRFLLNTSINFIQKIESDGE